MFLAFAVFGIKVPELGLLAPLLIVAVLFLLFNRNGGLGADSAEGGEVGTGRMFQCTRCGRNFQPASKQKLPNGQVRSEYDDRCPNCGWDLDWGDADNTTRPGGDSGGW